MANAVKLLATNPVRCLMVGYPGSGKTGSLACLLNAGFKMRFMDFDGNLEPLMLYADRDKLVNLDVLHFEDQMRLTSNGFMEPVGIPQAFFQAHQAMDHWRYKDDDGADVDLGHSRD